MTVQSNGPAGDKGGITSCSPRTQEAHPQKVSQPPPRNFRELHVGAGLAECLAVTGAWDEFDALIHEQPWICSEIATWFCEPGDPEAPALAEAVRRAKLLVAGAS